MKILFLVLMTLFTSVSMSAAEAPEAAKAKPIDPAAIAKVLTINEHDVVLGKADAPLTMVEYSSLSCGHCAKFHNEVLPALKTAFIETGKLRFMNRDYPLNAPALKGAMLVQCAPTDKRAKFFEVLFKLQEKWAFTPSYEDALKKIAVIGGIKENTLAACMNDKAIEERLLAQTQAASEALDIQGTPTFYLNGEKLAVPLDVKAFTDALNTKLDALNAAAKP